MLRQIIVTIIALFIFSANSQAQTWDLFPKQIEINNCSITLKFPTVAGAKQFIENNQVGTVVSSITSFMSLGKELVPLPGFAAYKRQLQRSLRKNEVTVLGISRVGNKIIINYCFQ